MKHTPLSLQEWMTRLNVKVIKVNELLSEELSIREIDFINSDNIIHCIIWKDGLQLNDGHMRKFSLNVSKVIDLCWDRNPTIIRESKLQRFLQDLKRNGKIDIDIYSNIYATG